MTVPVAGRTVIELGARATVLEAVERITAAAAADDLVLSIASGAPIARNAVFFEVARRTAATRRLAIVSSDARARALASAVHLPAFATTAALERQELDATEPLTSARRAALARPVRIKRGGPSPLRLLGIVGSLLGAVLVLTAVVAPTATVTVAPVAKELGPSEFDLRAGPDGDITSALTLTANVTQKYSAPATGSRTEPIKAKGVARFSNQSTQDIRVAKGTIVRTRDDIRFVTTDEKVIPRSSITIIPPFVEFGRVDIAIEAVDPGPRSNVPANAITVSDRNEYSVTNAQATGGGEIKIFPIITSSDYDRAVARAGEELRKAGPKQVDEWKKSALRGHVIYGPVMKVITVTPNASVVGSEPATPSFELTVSGTARAYSVPDSEPRGTTVRKLGQQADPDKEIEPAGATVEIIVEPTIDYDSGVRWRVRARASQFVRLNESALRSGLAGHEFGEAQDIVERSGVLLQQVEWWPGWWPRLPLLDSRIVIKRASSAVAP